MDEPTDLMNPFDGYYPRINDPVCDKGILLELSEAPDDIRRDYVGKRCYVPKPRVNICILGQFI